MDYNLELEKAARAIRENNAGLVCIQLPDGLKQKATDIVAYLEKSTGANIIIWASSCFGACDIPNVNADLLIQWGHTTWEDV